jgi:tRNA nucleotidyltransferase/poly(A) polymerase
VSALQKLLADPGVAKIFGVLDGGSEETRIAGGAVRDTLLGKMPAEIDFATTAEPKEVVRRANAAGLKTAPTGIEHGTVTVIVDKRPYEVTTLRRDVETDGRHAVVAFGRDWAEDAQRRDFTINGLFLDRAGKIHDFVGGEADLKARRVRFIGDARTRIREDYLRILRFFRFFAGYAEGPPDAEAFSAAVSERGGLDHLSRERIRAELMKLLVAPRASEAVKRMAEAGLMGAILGGMARPRAFVRMTEIEAGMGLAPDAVRRLGALALFIPENAARLRARLRLSNDETNRLANMAGRPDITPALSAAGRKSCLYRLGADIYRDRALFYWARTGNAARDVFDFSGSWTPPEFPVTAAQLMERGVEQGPRLGAMLEMLEEEWIAAGFPEDKATLDRLIAAAMA